MIHLDHHATTPTDPRVAERMLPWLTERFGNPGSRHAAGYAAARAVEDARAEVAALIGGRADEVVFTSGATEANNLAVLGIARALRRARPRIAVSAVEHPSVAECARAVAEEGGEAVVVPVDSRGLLDLDRLAAAVDGRTALVSVQAANHEVGTIQPLEAVAALCRRHGALLHADAAQAAGKVPLDVGALGVDLLSLSGHKLYGPPGIGALWLSRRLPVAPAPLLHGGGQERGLRPGTPPVALCVGLGAACSLAAAEMAEEGRRLTALRGRLLERLRQGIPGLAVNGDPERRLPGNLNVRIPGVDAAALLEDLPELALSTGSACASARREPSPVLRALGLGAREAAESVRIGLGRATTEAEVDRAAELLVAAVRARRAL